VTTDWGKDRVLHAHKKIMASLGAFCNYILPIFFIVYIHTSINCLYKFEIK